MSETLSIIIEMALACGVTGVLLAADHVIMTRRASRRRSATIARGEAVAAFLTVHRGNGGGRLDTREPRRHRKPEEWTVINGLRDARV